MPLVAWFPQILAVHVGTVAVSGSLFALRGAARMAGWPVANHPALRCFSYLNDTLLLTAAILLTLIVHQYPLLDAWLTVKVLLLAVYIVLGVIALRRGRSPRARAWAYGAALATFGLIITTSPCWMKRSMPPRAPIAARMVFSCSVPWAMASDGRTLLISGA